MDIDTSPFVPDAKSIKCCTSTGDKNFFTSITGGAQLITLRFSCIVELLMRVLVLTCPDISKIDDDGM